VSLIKLRRARKITEREEKTGHDTEHDNPDSFDNRVPESQKIKPASLFEKIDIRRTRGDCDRSGRRQRRN